MTRLPAEAFAPADTRAAARPGAPHLPERRQDRGPGTPTDELADIYAVALIALPLALFLKWLWP